MHAERERFYDGTPGLTDDLSVLFRIKQQLNSL